MSAATKSATPKLEKILIADDEHLVVEGLSKNLKQLDYLVLGACPNGEEAVEFCRRDRPDMALLDIRMPKLNGLEAAKTIFGEMNIPVVILSAFSDPEYTKVSADIGVFGYVLKPVTLDDLRVTLPVAWRLYLNHLESRDQIQQLNQRLEDRKTIEKAKWILVEKLGVDEENAMKRLQKQARDNRRTLIDVARGILENHQLFGQDEV
ncbi:MAG: ANTAR domain-containing response regulator [Phycisphaerales bacterium]